MASGHLDMETGKWIDTTEADDDKAFAAEQEQHGKPPIAAADAPPVAVAPGSPAAAMAGPAPGPTGPASSPPLSAIEKAKLLQFVQSNAGNPVAVAAARQMLLSDGGRGAPAAPSPPAVPPVPAGPMPPAISGPTAPTIPGMRSIQVGSDGLARPMQGPTSMADKARLAQQMRARAMQSGVQ